jgi:hypothetical protein
MAEFGESQSQVHSQRGFAHASFAGTDGDNGANTRYGLGPLRRLSGTRRHVGAQAITWEEESKD